MIDPKLISRGYAALSRIQSEAKRTEIGEITLNNIMKAIETLESEGRQIEIVAGEPELDVPLNQRGFG